MDLDMIIKEEPIKDHSIMDEEWSPEFLDSIFENNTDLLSVFDDPNKFNEITSDLMEYEEHQSPLSSIHSDNTDLEQFLLDPAKISSAASDSGLSSDNLDFETSPDYEPLSPTLSSPGPSISERGGQNSPPRFQKVAKVTPTVHKKFNTRSSTAAAAAAAAAANMTAVSPKLVQAVAPTPKAHVTGMKRGASTATHSNGPKAKEVKVYRVQPNQGSVKKTTTAPATTKTTGAALSNGVRKILINTMDVKDLRTIKIINANTLKNPHLKIAAANLLQQSKQGLLPKNAMLPKEQYEMQVKQEMIFDEAGDDDHNLDQHMMMNENPFHKTEDDDAEEDDSDDDDDRYQSAARGAQDKLVLTAEEKRLLAKEGITLPSNYPLTKQEERELKRIRRKIRNKISAQDSRKRKKEYVDGLEERVKQCTDDNQSLMKRIKQLQSQNQNLMTQMKKLQNLLSKTNNSSTTQPTTCLMVLLLSMALIAAPNLKLGKDRDLKDTELAEAIQETLQQNRRTLSYNTVSAGEEDLNGDLSEAMLVCNENDFIAENENFIENFYNRIGVGGGRKQQATKKAVPAFMDLDLDEGVWRKTKDSAPKETSASTFGGLHASVFSDATGGRTILGQLGPSGAAVDKMDNVLIMELRNNLLGLAGHSEEEADGGRKINNSMHVVHHHTGEGINGKILFQD